MCERLFSLAGNSTKEEGGLEHGECRKVSLSQQLAEGEVRSEANASTSVTLQVASLNLSFLSFRILQK